MRRSTCVIKIIEDNESLLNNGIKIDELHQYTELMPILDIKEWTNRLTRLKTSYILAHIRYSNVSKDRITSGYAVFVKSKDPGGNYVL